LKLIKARSAKAQELGGSLIVLPENMKWAREMDIIEIVRLASHEILSIRQASWKILSEVHEKALENPVQTGKVMRFFDAKWEDSRKFARDEFSKFFTEKDWTPELLIGLCDSIFEDVRYFGRELIKKYFKSEQGLEYLVKLSEHPSSDIQTFVTAYLENYASGDTGRIAELIPYFKRVLAGVNRSRIAKDRILTFLSNEANANEEIGRIVSDIMSWYYVTISKKDRAKAVKAMLQLHRKYPSFDLPLKVIEPEAHRGV
jgi:hypothetical protein